MNNKGKSEKAETQAGRKSAKAQRYRGPSLLLRFWAHLIPHLHVEDDFGHRTELPFARKSPLPPTSRFAALIVFRFLFTMESNSFGFTIDGDITLVHRRKLGAGGYGHVREVFIPVDFSLTYRSPIS